MIQLLQGERLPNKAWNVDHDKPTIMYILIGCECMLVWECAFHVYKMLDIPRYSVNTSSICTRSDQPVHLSRLLSACAAGVCNATAYVST